MLITKKTNIKMKDQYFGTKCKIVFVGRNLLQEKENEFIAKYPEHNVKDIGYQSENGYVYKLAVFAK